MSVMKLNVFGIKLKYESISISQNDKIFKKPVNYLLGRRNSRNQFRVCNLFTYRRFSF